VQLWNALLPIDVTLLGIVTDPRELQPRNALSAIDVTPVGIAKLVKASQFRKAKQVSLEFTVEDKQPYEVVILDDNMETLVSELHP